MTVHLRRDLEFLKREILDMGAMVESAVNKAISALVDRREALAQEVLRGDDLIDDKEVAIELDCQKVLALHQPVASDLRFVLAVLKVNNDLERVGDLASHIAERAVSLAAKPALDLPSQFVEIGELTRRMMRECLDALVQTDAELARGVLDQDDGVDRCHRELFEALEARMIADPRVVSRALEVMACSRHLERVADLATNISEEVIYVASGEVVRHGRHG